MTAVDQIGALSSVAGCGSVPSSRHLVDGEHNAPLCLYVALDLHRDCGSFGAVAGCGGEVGYCCCA